MSEGPIKRARESFARRPPASTTASKSLHAVGGYLGDRSYCGRKVGVKLTTSHIEQVTCSDCLASLAADGFHKPGALE